MSVQDVVTRYVGETNLPLRKFAAELTASVKANISHVAVQNWMVGKNEPATDLMLQVLVAHRDWRRNFALEVLREKMPEVFADGVGELCDALCGEGGIRRLEPDEWEKLVELIKERMGKDE